MFHSEFLRIVKQFYAMRKVIYLKLRWKVMAVNILKRLTSLGNRGGIMI